MIGEQHHVAQLALDTIEFSVFGKKPPEALLAHIRPDRRGIAAFPGDRERGRIQIRREDLHLRTQFVPRRFFLQKHCHRIRFFSRRAAGDPHAYRAGVPTFENARKHFFRENFERLRVAKERRDRDEQIGEQRL